MAAAGVKASAKGPTRARGAPPIFVSDTACPADPPGAPIADAATSEDECSPATAGMPIAEAATREAGCSDVLDGVEDKRAMLSLARRESGTRPAEPQGATVARPLSSSASSTEGKAAAVRRQDPGAP